MSMPNCKARWQGDRLVVHDLAAEVCEGKYSIEMAYSPWMYRKS